MYLIIYVSSATVPFSEKDLIELLEKARTNNAKLDITGMLLYRDGNFMQLLEGPQSAVVSLVEKIRKDSRHHGFLKLLEQKTDEREFSEWQMGFKNLDHKDETLPAYSSFLNTPFNSDEYQQTPSKALKLLLGFKKMMR